MLLSIFDKEKRSFYEKEAVNSGWSVRELRRQMESSLFERLLLSRGDANKEQVLALAEKGVDYTEPEDIIKDPYVFEFLGLPEEKPFLECDLEAALVRQSEDFLLELGRGFMFVGTQQRVTVNNTHYYVDMVFYNKILHAYVLIELKTTKLTPEAAGKIKMMKSLNVSSSSNLIGNTVDQAIALLDKYLDDAYLAKLHQIAIIHGVGTGALRNAVQAHLKKSKYINTYRMGEYGEGGYGVTVAEFK